MAKLKEYVVGQVFQADATITKSGGLIDPVSLTYTIEKPDGTDTAYVYGSDVEVVRLSLGKFRLLVPLTSTYVGRCDWRLVTTGAAEGANQGSFLVKASNL